MQLTGGRSFLVTTTLYRDRKAYPSLAALGIGVINTVQSVFLNDELRTRAPDVPFQLVRQSTEEIYRLPVEQQPAVVEAYVIAITESLIPIIVALGLGWISAIFVKRHNMLKRGVQPGAGAV